MTIRDYCEVHLILNRGALAERCGISWAIAHRIWQGDPCWSFYPKVLKKLCAGLQLEMSELFALMGADYRVLLFSVDLPQVVPRLGGPLWHTHPERATVVRVTARRLETDLHLSPTRAAEVMANLQ